MLFADHLVVLRGGGDLGTGVAYRLHRAGFPVVVLELAQPLTIRRTVAVSTAVREGEITVEGMPARLAASEAAAAETATGGTVAVLVEEGIPEFPGPLSVLVDARLAKRNVDTTIDLAPLVVGLGPGFSAGRDCHAVVETKRGHHLGRVIWEGAAAPDTGIPGEVGGQSGNRVIRAPVAGAARWSVEIGDAVVAGQVIGRVGEAAVEASIGGVVRGLIADGYPAEAGLKLADIDPRGDAAVTLEISDKALAVGGGVLEAVLTWLNRRQP
jgi:xanthine dehydrogenase accessory factor